MERYQLVHSALQAIQEKYRPFFDSSNSNIKQYVNIEPNATKDWINVPMKKDSGLSSQLIEDVKKTFVFIE
jgi:hypothetical protein